MPRQAKPRWHKGAKLWYACIGPPGKDGRRTEVYAPAEFGPRDEAKAWAWLEERKARRKEAETPVEPEFLTVASLGELYLTHADARRQEGQLSEAHFRSKGHHVGHLAAALGDRIARTLTPHDMERFIDSLRTHYKANYVANICATVSAVFNWAVRAGHIEANPVRGFDVPVVPKSSTRFAEGAEAAVWLRYLWRRTVPTLAARRYDRLDVLMQRILIHSGARPGELCCLLWTDIKWAGWKAPSGHICARITIPPERWKTGKATGKSRTIFVPPVLTRALRREFEREGRHPTHVFVHGRGRGGRGDSEPWADGSTLSKRICRLRRDLIERQREILGRVGLGEDVPLAERNLIAVVIRDEGENRLVNYRWRHTAISTLMMMGIDVPTIGELTGTSPEMIYRVYGHLLDKHLTEAAAKLVSRKREGR